MITDAEIDELRAQLSNVEAIDAASFGIVSELARLVAHEERETQARELVIRALENRERFGPAAKVLDSLVREVGLYPYLDPTKLHEADIVAYEFHRPTPDDEGLVFHRVQASVFWSLMNGESVVLSAPTSFGKSLIIDAVIAAKKYNNIVVVVPTIALIDETRRRLSKYSAIYKIITHHSQERSDKNIFVLTQERVVDREDLDEVDFFVIDEFYGRVR